MMTEDWFRLKDPDAVDSPVLLVYRDRVEGNIDKMVAIAGSPSRLVPHVKTHKMREVVDLQVKRGIRRYKCATIAEAEMLAEAGAESVLIAYQLNEPKIGRYLELRKAYTGMAWASLVDNLDSARLLHAHLGKEGLDGTVFIDIDNGMHRTGIAPEGAWELIEGVRSLRSLNVRGLHVYDGHIRHADFEVRKQMVEEALQPVEALARRMEESGMGRPEVIAGGTPTFTVHALHREELCSPGTCVFWDYGYGHGLPEQPFLPAAVLMTRVISRPAPDTVTTDLGHKSVAAENPIDKRIFFLNLDGYQVVSQSEEHLVLKIKAGFHVPGIGEVLYGVPYHICPTVALHDEARVVEDGELVGIWPVIARRRRINI